MNKSVNRKSEARTSDNSTRVSAGILRAFVAGLRLLFYLFFNATCAVRVICCIFKVFFVWGLSARLVLFIYYFISKKD